MKKQVIAIASSGWVFVGTPAAALAPDTYALEDAAVIRKWGTDRGIGQLALHGVTPETILDPVGKLVINRTNLICLLEVQAPEGIKILW